jgi:LysR family nitrogen assimilation transcriptional regulator
MGGAPRDIENTQVRTAEQNRVMETRRLDYFVQIVDSGSITKAAARLGIAQPALSQQLAILEAEFKTKLLLRNAQGVELTASGATLYKQALVVLRQLRHAHEMVAEENASPSGSVSIGLPTTTANLLSLPILEATRSQYPNVRLQIKEGLSGDIAELVAKARLDIALLFASGAVQGLDVHPLWVEELLLVGPGEATMPKRISLSDAARLPLVMPAQGNGARNVLNAVLARQSLEPNIVAEIDSTISLKRAVQRGLGYTFLPWAAIFEEVGRDELTVTAVDEPDMVRTVAMCSPASVPGTRAIECLKGIILERVSDLLDSRRVPGMRAP